MLLEDFAGELNRPIRALNILAEEIEIMIEENIQTNEETKKVLSVLFAMKCVIKETINLHKKYNNLIDKEYEKIRAAKAAPLNS